MPSQVWFDSTMYPCDYIESKAFRRSMGTVGRILDKPTDITIERHNEALDPQTVRIEGQGRARFNSTRAESNSNTSVREITIFGVRQHTDIPDLDIQINDRFGYEDMVYIVTHVTTHSGEVQAHAERFTT